VVATASLELGIDIGHVDLVCHLGAPRALATLLQRVGRSGHWLGSVPKGVLFPLTRDELVQCAAAVQAARAGELDRIVMPRKPLDVLAQQMVAIAASEEIREDDLWALIRRTLPYHHLPREEFEQIVQMLSEGISSRRGRAGAFVHRDQIHGVLRGRRGARLAAITSGGAIPDTADYDVIEEPQGTFVGKVNEDFAIESQGGDIFLLGNTSWRIRRVEAGKVRVENAHGAPPSVPFWLGEAPARTAELSQAVSALRQTVADRLGEQHSFPLDSVFAFVRTATAKEDLIQALLASPMFTNRWRWNANRALAVLRYAGGRRVPMPIQRMRAEDLMAAVFPEQVACQDNRSGPVTPPDHPLVNE